MKTLLLSLALLVTGSAWAEWVKVSANSIMDAYIDNATIQKDANFRKVWQVQDMYQRQSNGELSRRARFEYDCTKEVYRYTSVSNHSGHMATGETLSINDGIPWRDVPPNTVGQDILRIVCAK